MWQEARVVNKHWCPELIHMHPMCHMTAPQGCLFADEKLMNLKNKKYSDYQFEPGEWEILGSIQDVLAVCESI